VANLSRYLVRVAKEKEEKEREKEGDSAYPPLTNSSTLL
jgi:hypothetical protein